MNLRTTFLLTACVLATLTSITCTSIDEFKQKIAAAKDKTNEILERITKRWQIKDYPNFLKSMAMTHTGWEVLKLNFESKILGTFKGKKEKFVISFMGSSVTAGHDTKFNITFPSLVGVVMSPPFEILGVQLESHNAAMGNNPCVPYDMCVHAFAGPEADLVHWEQSFNCFGNDGNSRVMFEHFIRGALSLPNQAVVVFSESPTSNWGKEECKEVKTLPPIPDDEKKLLELIDKDPMKVVTELNKNDHQGPWSAMTDLFKKYKIAGIQTWTHHHYEKYKCHGPYVADWGCCAASWHPSILGHELRADHYSYFWLLIFRDALNSLSSVENIDDALKQVKKRIHFEHKYIPKETIYKSNFSDTLQCYTSFQPLADPNLSLYNLVIPQTEKDGKLPWKSGIMEDFIDNGNIVKRAREQGYLDYKMALYGNKDSLPLSLKLDIKNEGIVHLCEPPGNWGKLPDGFSQFYRDGMAKAYLTRNVESFDKFEFKLETAREVPIHDIKKGTQYPCAEIEEVMVKGKHVLTIIPQKEVKMMLSTVILP